MSVKCVNHAFSCTIVLTVWGNSDFWSSRLFMIWSLHTRLDCYLHSDHLWLILFSYSSFLAQTPDAWTKKVKELLDFMLSVEGEDEQRFVSSQLLTIWYLLYISDYLSFVSLFPNYSPFNSVCFLLPMLCQITMSVEGCKTLISSGGLAAVSNFSLKIADIK